MKIYVVDFEQVLKNFIPYHESLDKIKSEKDKFAVDIERVKKDMEGVISASRLLIDEKIQREQALKFKELQAKGIQLESEFRSSIVELQNSELEKNFEEVSKIVEEWGEKAELDLVLNKSQALFVNDKYNATDSIIYILKSKGLYRESLVSEDIQ